MAHGPKPLAFDLRTNQLLKSIPLDKYVKRKRFFDDLRFHGNLIYVTDAGAPGLIVLDQKTGRGRRLLDGDGTTTARRPMLGEDQKMVKPNGGDVALHADQMEVSPDGKYYYFQTAAEPPYRVETKYLDDPNVKSADLAKRVTYFFNSPTRGGTTIDAAGNLYVADANGKRILKVTPGGQSSVLGQDPRLIWADARWLDRAGNLWIPAPQLNRTAGFQKAGKRWPSRCSCAKCRRGPGRSGIRAPELLAAAWTLRVRAACTGLSHHKLVADSY